MPPRTKVHLEKISKALKGRKKGPTPQEVRLKISESQKKIVHTPEWNRKVSESQRGSKGNNWQGGKTPEAKRLRSTSEYKLWRRSVFERDEYTCVWCGRRGGNLNADHIKPFAFFPELRFAIDNGRTLCVECHRTTETFSHKATKMYAR